VYTLITIRKHIYLVDGHVLILFKTDDIADPGYSRLDGQRVRSINSVPVLPASAAAAASTSQRNVSSVPHHPTGAGLRAPVYAVVSKNSRHRQTVHVDGDIIGRGGYQEREGFGDAEGGSVETETARGNVYAQVARNRTHRRSSSNDPSLMGAANCASQSGRGGKANVIIPPPPASLFRNSSSYASIDSVIAGQSSCMSEDTDRARRDAVGVGDNPDNDNFRARSRYDRVYEDVRDTRGTNGSSNFGGGHTESLSNQHSGDRQSSLGSPRGHVTHEIRPALIREHIYEVVSESRRPPWDRASEPERLNHRNVVGNGDVHRPFPPQQRDEGDIIPHGPPFSSRSHDRSHDLARTSNRKSDESTDI